MRRTARAKPDFDGVELHYAHAYTMAGFLSALNDRGRRIRWTAEKTALVCRWRSIARCANASATITWLASAF